MSGQPGGGGGDFGSNIDREMSKLKQSEPAPPAAAPVGSGSASSDAFSDNLAKEMDKTSGQTESTGDDNAGQQTAGPVGQGDYIVREGDCMSSIAKEHGFFWETLWNAPENAELKQARKDPNVLLPDDRVSIPEKERKDEPIAQEQRHRFKRKGEPSKLRLRLMQGPAMIECDDDEEASSESADRPLGNVAYRLVVEHETIEGTADADGWVICSIPGDAKQGTLIVKPGEPDEFEMNLFLGRIAPVQFVTGVRQRLRNLGFDVEASDSSVLTSRLKRAIRAFQAQNKLDVTGDPDAATQDKLLEIHGC